MKKFAYIAGGVLIGVVVSTAGGAFADTVKSLVGKKVTGEYTIVVDGKTLSDKGAVIDSRANVPARALSEALGAEVSVSGKIITIESGNVEGEETQQPSTNSENPYIGKSKAYLESMKNGYITEIIPPLVEVKEKRSAILAESEKSGGGEITAQANAALKKEIADLDAEIAKYEAELKLIEEALATAK